MANFSPAAPTIYQSDPLGAFKRAYDVSSGIANEDDAKAALARYAESLYGQQPQSAGPTLADLAAQPPGSPAPAAAPQQPNATPSGPDLMKFGLPDQQTVIGLLRDPETRPQGLALIQQARAAYADANDPQKKLQLEKLQYDVAHQGDGPVDTTAREAGTRFKLGRDQGLTGDALRTYTLTGKLPDDAPGRSNTPSGYAWSEDGKSLAPIPGGPADPNTATMLSPEALDLVATQYLAGDRSAAVGYARNAALKAQITNAIAAKAAALGMDGKAVAAEISAYGGNVSAQRAAGTRAAQVGMAASEASQMADIALEASKAVPRTAIVPWNAAVNAFQTGTSSPEMAKFVTATTSLVNAYARAVSPLGAPTDAMRAHAEQMLNTAQGPEAYAAVIAQMKKEMEAALNAPAEVSASLKTNITGQPPESTAAPAVGAVMDGYRFKGGDPGDQNNWEPAQ
jgi:hypothetical protein